MGVCQAQQKIYSMYRVGHPQTTKSQLQFLRTCDTHFRLSILLNCFHLHLFATSKIYFVKSCSLYNYIYIVTYSFYLHFQTTPFLQDPWDWHFFLHLLSISTIDVGKSGSYGFVSFQPISIFLVCFSFHPNYRVLKSRGGLFYRGGGNWGTLRIPREDWGTFLNIKIRGITTSPIHP